MDVIQRLEPVITEVERERECICIVAHQAVLRALYAYFRGIPLTVGLLAPAFKSEAGLLFGFSHASVCIPYVQVVLCCTATACLASCCIGAWHLSTTQRAWTLRRHVHSATLGSCDVTYMLCKGR